MDRINHTFLSKTDGMQVMCNFPSTSIAYASPKRLKIGVLGRGRVAEGVFARLKEENAKYETFGRDRFWSLKRLNEFDVVINCWYFDPAVGGI